MGCWVGGVSLGGWERDRCEAGLVRRERGGGGASYSCQVNPTPETLAVVRSKVDPNRSHGTIIQLVSDQTAGPMKDLTPTAHLKDV